MKAARRPATPAVASSHANGYMFDFRKNSALDAYIEPPFPAPLASETGIRTAVLLLGWGNHGDVTYY
ncbi:hypothetical protein DL770_004211 [Monosporascus sp. CRB-9-2]|nr:hypothetical protein DL770_004211 [Monosporascus sp. CRB-9-2]